ncbi:MAG: glycosyltransferase family 2 protein [Thermoanaerobaculia bacterium]
MTAPNKSRILLSLVIPVFNEEENLPLLIQEISTALKSLPGDAEVLLVDDGSRDSSWQRIVEASETFPWVRGVRLLANRGQTAAMVAGIDLARGELVGFLDADLQNDPEDLIRLVEPIVAGEADLVCGWRKERRDRALDRRLPSMFANALLRKVFRLDLHDVGCSLKVVRRAFLEDVQLFGEMHRFIPYYAQTQGARIREAVVNHRERRFGASKYGLGRVGKVLIDMLTVKLLNAYGATPGYFFGKIALFFFLLGAAAFGVVAYRALFLDRPESTPMIFIMLLMFITGLLALMSGLLAEINIRVLHQVGGHRPYKIAELTGGEMRDEGAECAESTA